MRKQKWWWSMFFWGHDTLLLNTYIAYKRYMEMEGKHAMSHYDFRKAIVLAKVDPLGHGSRTQRESIAFQRGNPKVMPRVVNKRANKAAESTRMLSMRNVRSARARPRATGRSKAKAPKEQRGTYVTANRVARGQTHMSSMRLNTSLCHHPIPLPFLLGKPYGYGKCCSLCRWATGNKYTAQLSCCVDCDTILCVWSHKTFHTVKDLVDVKHVLYREILTRKHAKENTTQGRKNTDR